MTPAIVQAAQKCGLDPKVVSIGEWRCNCPFHSPKDEDTALVFSSGNWFKCWKCGANGESEEDLRYWMSFNERVAQ